MAKTTYGTAGNDPWYFKAAPSGSFILDGLGGIDSLDMGTTWREDYTITQAADGGVHVDSVSGASASLHGVLYNMEILYFNSTRDTLDLTTYFGNHLPTGAVSISGTATQGKTLIAANTLADADGLGAIGFQWKAGGVNIGGATSPSFVLTEAQVGKAITVAASYTDQLGTAESMLSSATGAVANVNDSPTGRVTVAGTATQGKALIAANSLADADGLGSISYLWKADGVAISGATSSSLVLTATQVGKAITVAASYTDGHGTAESMTSSATAAVLKLSDPGTAGQTVDLLAYSWNSHILLNAVGLSAGVHSVITDATGAAALAAVTETLLLLTASRIVPAAEASATSLAVNLTDAIAILKMIVGLDVNGAGKPLSPYQLYAADFDGNGRVELSDAISVLKHVVGLDAPKPNWTFFNEADSTVSSMLAQGKATLSPGTVPALSIGSGTVHLGLVGVLLGDVDGSYGLPVAAPALAPSYFVDLSMQDHLNLSQFGVYPA